MARSLARRLSFSAIMVAGCLVLLEAGMYVGEPYLIPARSIPLPAPKAPGVADVQAFDQQLKAARQASGIAVAMVEDERSGWALAPNTVRKEGNIYVRINALGLRGPEVTPKAAGELHLLTVGDSSIFGVEVEEKYVFSSVAAADLANALKTTVTAYIGGVPGYDSAQSLQNLQRVGVQVQPDWVIIGCLWSDVFRNDDNNQMRYRREVVGPMRYFATWRVLRGWLAPWLLSERVRWVDTPTDIGSSDGEGLPPRTSLPNYIKNLQALGNETKKLGGKPVYMILPAPMDFDRVPPPASVQAWRAAMAKVAAEQSAPLLDGPALFKEEGGMGYFVDHVHPSREGHVLLGHALAKLLETGD